MYRHRQRPDDFKYPVPSSIFVTNLSPLVEFCNKKTGKTPKTKTTPVRQRTKSNESKPRTPKATQEESDAEPKKRRTKKDTVEESIKLEEPILDGAKETQESPKVKPIRVRKKSSKLNESYNGESDTSEKKRKLKDTKISDFFSSSQPSSQSSGTAEASETKIKEEVHEAADPGEHDGATNGTANPAVGNCVKTEPEEIDPDLPYTPGIVWKLGAKCEAMDNDGNWYRSKMVQVSKEYKMVKIHFEGWKPKWDAWYMMDSDMLRAASDWADMDSSKLKGTAWKKRIDEPKPAKKAKPKKVKSKKITEQADEQQENHDTSMESLDSEETDDVSTESIRIEAPPAETAPEAEPAIAEELVFIDELKFEMGARLEAQDRSNHWYRGRIVAVSHEQQVVKVHYDGWKSRWDTWYTLDSERLRPLTRDWVDPKLMPKVKKKQKRKLAESPAVSADEPQSAPSDETLSPKTPKTPKTPDAEPPKKKRKRQKSQDSDGIEPLTAKIRLGASPVVANDETTPKRKKKKKIPKGEESDGMLEYLPESMGSSLLVLEEVEEEQTKPDEISYSNLLDGEEGTKRSKRKKRERSDASEWVSEEVLDHLTSEQEKTPEKVVNKRLSTSEPETPGEVKSKKRGRPKKVKELSSELLENGTIPNDVKLEPSSPKKEPSSPTKSPKKKKRKIELIEDAELDELADESPPSDVDEEDDYLPHGVKKPKLGKKGRPKKTKTQNNSMEKGSEWKKVGDEEFMDIPPPAPEFAVPSLPVRKKLKKDKKLKEKKVKKIKQVPEYTDAYNKAMLAMQLAQEKEKRRLERKLEKLKKKEIEEKSTKKKRRGPSAYQLFCSANRPRLMAQNPGASFAVLNKKLGETWHNIGVKEKGVWRRKSKKMKERGAGTQSSYSRRVKEITSLLKPGQKAAPEVQENILAAGNTSPYKVTGTEPLDAAAHLKLLGESLGIIGQRLVAHKGEFAVQGTLSVMLDSFLCSLGPLMCLTAKVPELDSLPQKTLASTLDSIAYFMPGL